MKQSPWVLLQELENREITHQRRRQIGEELAQIGDPRPGIGTKEGVPELQWLPVTPGGKVTVMRAYHPETPEEVFRVVSTHDFNVEPFYIAKYPVTYAQYEAFVTADDGFDNMLWWQDMPEAYQRQPLAEQRTKLSNNARDSLSWYQSVAFARWITHRLKGFELPHPSGKGMMRVGDNAQIRLPTEWEWQWAAQNGSETRSYPWRKEKLTAESGLKAETYPYAWGEEHPGYANTAESGLKQAIAVGMYPHGAAACGALDMAGNLMEWCANNKEILEIVDIASDAQKVLRGGDWGYSINNASCTYADGDAPSRIDALNGCRLILG